MLAFLLECFPQVLYPVLTFVMIWRTISARVRPDTLIVFKPNDNVDDAEDGAHNTRSTLSKIKAGWKTNRSLLSWADTGAWETAETADEGSTRDRDWFRIGFEPLFVDFTKAGCWFELVTLVEVSLCAGAVIA